MSYCRFSSDNWKSDVYCYESDHGFETHVASNRIVGTIPRLKSIDDDGFMQAYRAQMAFLDKAEKKSIGLDFDGESYTDKTLVECKSRLLQLRESGYHVPDYVFEMIDEELLEDDDTT